MSFVGVEFSCIVFDNRCPKENKINEKSEDKGYAKTLSKLSALL